MALLLILAVVLFGFAAALVFSAIMEPKFRRSENLTQIDAYGYVTKPEEAPEKPNRRREKLDRLASSIGELLSRLTNAGEEGAQRELIAAGYFRMSARRFTGYRVLSAIATPLCLAWLLGLAGASNTMLIVFVVIGAAVGWIGPNFVVHRKARLRLQHIDDALPALIDLLVVTLEAGIGFSAALKMASQRLQGPLGDEIRLTIQEQGLGLSTLESLENWLRRCDTPSVRSFVRAMVQGDRLGVSIGSILRNQAVEMRARRRQVIEERAQKAPIKILFPLVFLIFPAMFVIILGPAVFAVAKSFHT